MDKLGGNRPVQQLTGDQPSTVSNWRNQDHFPARHYVLINEVLQPLGYCAPPWLFGMTQRAARKRLKKRRPPPIRQKAKPMQDGGNGSGKRKRTRQLGSPLARRSHRKAESAMAHHVGQPDRPSHGSQPRGNHRQGASAWAATEET
jgi:hypothetical protein